MQRGLVGFCPYDVLSKLTHLIKFAFSDIYKDSNHKPEMIIALTDFEALCDFRPIEAIRESILDVPELAACLGEDWENLGLRDWFTHLMKCEPSFVQEKLILLKVPILA